MSKNKIITKIAGTLLLSVGAFAIITINLLISKDYAFLTTKEKSLSFFVILLALSFLYVMFVFNDVYQKNQLYYDILIVLLSLELCLICGIIVEPYMRPYIMVSIIICTLYKKNSAFFSGIYLVIIAMLFDYIKYPTIQTDILILFFFGLINISVGAYFSTKNYLRLSLFLLAICVSLSNFITTYAFSMFFEIDKTSALTNAIYSALSPLIGVMLANLLLPMFEYITKTTTNYRLYEICDSSRGLLKVMKEKAAGTYNHSLMTANLAEACANKIGVDAMLARAAALYHDVGKLINPQYFSENQIDGNPHDDLPPETSANIIRLHTQNGYEMCIANNIPTQIAEICREHHGTLPIAYFYAKAKKLTEGDLSVEDFSYKGPKPSTKIAAIIMIVDGAEASIRASKSKDAEKIEEITRKVIENRIEFGQFSESDLTFKDIDDIKDAIIESYSGVYHERIKYPKVSFSKRG